MAARISVLLSLTFWACSPSEKQILSHSFPTYQWVYPDTVWGLLEVPTAPLCYDVELQVDLQDNYPWRNLYLQLYVLQPDGFRQQSRLELVFADSLGKWYVSNRKFRTFVARNLSFASVGTYRIGLLPFIRQDTVVGIRRVALYAHPCQ